MRVALLLPFFLLLGFVARAQVDTVQTYWDLLGYSGSADTVFVDHDRYHGLFVTGTCTTTNYGTTFYSGGTCWQRIHTNYLPRYWAIGGSSPVANSDVVKEEVDAINAAAWSAMLMGGDTIEIDSMVPIDR